MTTATATVTARFDGIRSTVRAAHAVDRLNIDNAVQDIAAFTVTVRCGADVVDDVTSVFRVHDALRVDVDTDDEGDHRTDARYQLLGVNDEETTCSLCGRTELKRVAWLAELRADGTLGEPVHYGTDCAGKLLYGRKSAGNTKLVRDRGERLAKVARWLRDGHPADKVAQAWRNMTCLGAVVVDADTVRVACSLTPGDMVTISR